MDFLRMWVNEASGHSSVCRLPSLDYPGYGRDTRIVYLVYVASSQISDLTECPGVSERSVYPAL